MKTTAVVHAAALAAVLLVNALANILPINGIGTGELSDMYPNLFVPAGITFSIWGLIYLLLILWVGRQFYISHRRIGSLRTQISASVPWFLISCIGNILWIITWHYQYLIASLLMMLVIFFSLIKLYLAIGVGTRSRSISHRLLYHLPISVYLGWISVALIANITAALVHFQWQRFGLSEVFWTVVVIIAALAVGLAMLVIKKDIFHPLVVLWAFAGIIIKRSSAEPVYTPVITTAWIGIALIAVGVIAFLVLKRSYLYSCPH